MNGFSWQFSTTKNHFKQNISTKSSDINSGNDKRNKRKYTFLGSLTLNKLPAVYKKVKKKLFEKKIICDKKKHAKIKMYCENETNHKSNKWSERYWIKWSSVAFVLKSILKSMAIENRSWNRLPSNQRSAQSNSLISLLKHTQSGDKWKQIQRNSFLYIALISWRKK